MKHRRTLPGQDGTFNPRNATLGGGYEQLQKKEGEFSFFILTPYSHFH
jgi:hypothetical protein